MPEIIVGGIVNSEKEPSIQIDVDGHLVQLSMKQARLIANDILIMCSRTEADALVIKFFVERLGAKPESAASALLLFREFRAQLDDEEVTRFRVDPDDV